MARRFHPDAPFVMLDNLAAQRQTNAGAGVAAARLKPFEHLEQARFMAWQQAHAVVAHFQAPFAADRLRRNGNLRFLA